MDHGIDGQWQPRFAYEPGGAPFFGLRAGTMGDAIARIRVDILDAELNVFEPGIPERRHAHAIEPDPGSNQVAVEADRRGMPDDRGEVAPGERLAAREMRLQDAEFGRLAHYPPPAVGIELGAPTFQGQRV